MARVQAVLRRSPGRPTDVPAAAVPGGQVDFLRREIRFADGRREDLSEREGELLRYLLMNSGRVIGRDELLRSVWRLEPRGLWTRTIDMHIARLREKLGDDASNPKLILTVRGKGYMYGIAEGDVVNRPRTILALFAACLAVVLAAMAWVSVVVVGWTAATR